MVNSGLKGLKHHFASLKNDLVSWNQGNETFHRTVLKITVLFSFVTHFKSFSCSTSRAIHGLLWMNMTIIGKFRLQRANTYAMAKIICSLTLYFTTKILKKNIKKKVTSLTSVRNHVWGIRIFYSFEAADGVGNVSFNGIKTAPFIPREIF